MSTTELSKSQKRNRKRKAANQRKKSQAEYQRKLDRNNRINKGYGSRNRIGWQYGNKATYQSRKNDMYNRTRRTQPTFKFSQAAISYFDIVFNPLDTAREAVKPDSYGANNAYCYDSSTAVQPTITVNTATVCSGVVYVLVPLFSNFSNTYGADGNVCAYQILYTAVGSNGAFAPANSARWSRLSWFRYSSYFSGSTGLNSDTAVISDIRINGWGMRALSPINNITSVATSDANYVTIFHGGMLSLNDLFQTAEAGSSFTNLMVNARNYRQFDTTHGCSVRLDPFDETNMTVPLSLYEVALQSIDVSDCEVPFIFCQLGANTASTTSFTLPVNLYSYIHFEGKPSIDSIFTKIENAVDENIETAIKMVDDHNVIEDLYVTEGHSFKSFTSWMGKAARTGVKVLNTASKVVNTIRPYVELAAAMA